MSVSYVTNNGVNIFKNDVSIGRPVAGGTLRSPLSPGFDGQFIYWMQVTGGQAKLFRTPNNTPGVWTVCAGGFVFSDASFYGCAYDGTYLYIYINGFLYAYNPIADHCVLIGTVPAYSFPIVVWNGSTTIYMIDTCFNGANGIDGYTRMDITTRTITANCAINRKDSADFAITLGYFGGNFYRVAQDSVDSLYYCGVGTEAAGPTFGIALTYQTTGIPSFASVAPQVGSVFTNNSSIQSSFNTGPVSEIDLALPNVTGIGDAILFPTPGSNSINPLYGYTPFGQFYEADGTTAVPDGLVINLRPTAAGFPSVRLLLNVLLNVNTTHTLVFPVPNSGDASAYVQVSRDGVTWSSSIDLGAGIAGFLLPFYIRVFPPAGMVIEGNFILECAGS